MPNATDKDAAYDVAAVLAIATTDITYQEVTWSTFGTMTPTGFPMVEIGGPALRLGCNYTGGGLTIMDQGSSTLTDAYVDITRWGRL